MMNQLLKTPVTKTASELYDDSVHWLKTATISTAANGFIFTEGAVWHPCGFFLFSDTPANKMYCLTIQGKTSLFLEHSGFTGNSIQAAYLSDQAGSNGIAIDKQNNIIICQHGNHAISKLTADKELSVVVDTCNGRPFNSPNDVIIDSSGTLYFSDPPYGLAGQVLQPNHFQPAAGIFQFANGVLRLIGTELGYPNGLLLSPDEKCLFVSSNHPADPGIVRYKLSAGGHWCYDQVFIDQHADGMTMGPDNNIYLATDDGVLIISAAGKKLALIALPETASNLCWGGADQEILLVTARTSLYTITKAI